MKMIKVTIPQFGAPKVEAEGFNGEGCTEATKPIEQALTKQGTADVQYKPEWSNPVDEENTEQEHIQW